MPTDGDHDADDTRTFVADAGANTISEVKAGGRTRVIAYIPNETAGALRDATPTCIAQGPDGMLYVGTLDLVSNFVVGPGQSNVWRVDPGSTRWRHNATLWATGFTTINGCTFDRAGNFWASELFFPNDAGAPGDLAMAPFAHPDTITHLGGGSVPLPGGIDQGPDRAMYVSVGAADPSAHSGGVLRVAQR
jgi:glucose/arabinose dehydrogenase